jgi:hypothetical protein
MAAADEPLGDERPDDRDSESIAGRAANGEGGDAEQDAATLFPMGQFEGDGVTLGKLVKPGQKVETTVALSKAEIPSSGGLIDPNKAGRVLISYLPGKVEEVPHRESDDDRITRWTFRQHLRATYAQPANDEVDVIRSEFAALVELDQVRALSLAKELADVAKQAKQTA